LMGLNKFFTKSDEVKFKQLHDNANR
jgi:hypothetical protein